MMTKKLHLQQQFKVPMYNKMLTHYSTALL